MLCVDCYRRYRQTLLQMRMSKYRKSHRQPHIGTSSGIYKAQGLWRDYCMADGLPMPVFYWVSQKRAFGTLPFQSMSYYVKRAIQFFSSVCIAPWELHNLVNVSKSTLWRHTRTFAALFFLLRLLLRQADQPEKNCKHTHQAGFVGKPCMYSRMICSKNIPDYRSQSH